LTNQVEKGYHRSSSSNVDESKYVGYTQKSLGHLVCLVGAPKERLSGVCIHQVPIKLFHTNRDVGNVLSNWLTVLLGSGKLKLPETVFEDGGLEANGAGLEKIKSGALSGKRLVVRLDVK
jgi:hypothetical protein